MMTKVDDALERLLVRRADKQAADAAARAKIMDDEEARLNEDAAIASRLRDLLPFAQEVKRHIESLIERVNKSLGDTGFSATVDLSSFKVAHRVEIMAATKPLPKRTYGLSAVVYQDGKIEVATTKKEILSEAAPTVTPSEVAEIAVARLLEMME